MDVLQLTQAFIERGWAICPVPYQTKVPDVTWPTATFPDVESFKTYGAINGATEWNVALLCGGFDDSKPEAKNLLVLDGDWPEASRLLGLLLPKETLVFGHGPDLFRNYIVRTDRLFDTRKYRVPKAVLAPIKETADRKPGIVLEVKSKGQQALLPGSIHPKSKACYQFANPDAEVAALRVSTLGPILDRVVAGSALVYFWEDFPNQKHDLTLALTGAMLHADWGEQEIAGFLTAVFSLIPSEALPDRRKDRQKAIESTVELFQRDQPVTQWGAVEEILGEDLANWIKPLLGVVTDVTEMITLPVIVDQPLSITPGSLPTTLGNMIMSDEQVEDMSKATFLIPDLLIKNHVLAICAPPNGGKSTIMQHHCKDLVAKDMTVFYIHADCPADEAKTLHGKAKREGWKLVTPHFIKGKSSKDVLASLCGAIDQDEDLTNTVLIFDTLKKFTSVFKRDLLTEFMDLVRRLTSRSGATVIFLAHVNKNKNMDGETVFSGYSDLQDDIDEMIYFDPMKDEKSGKLVVTTRIAKSRGQFAPRTYEISTDRRVKRLNNVVDVAGIMAEQTQFKKDLHVINACKEAIRSGVNGLTAISKHLASGDHCGENKAVEVLGRYSIGTHQQWSVVQDLKTQLKTFTLK